MSAQVAAVSAIHVSASDQIDLIVKSEMFKNSVALCRILKYLADCAALQPGVAVKEYQIATVALGRSEKFDPRADASVRVNMSRLRSLLTRYYAGPGSQDQLRISIPRGTYQLRWESQRPHLRRPQTPAFTTGFALLDRLFRWTGVRLLSN